MMGRPNDRDVEAEQFAPDVADGMAPLWAYALATWRYDCSVNVLAGVDCRLTIPRSPVPGTIAFPAEGRP